MSWRTLLGLPPTRNSFARELIDHARRAGAPDWRYDAQDGFLIDGRDNAQRVNLDNLSLEYLGAHRTDRSAPARAQGL